MSIASSHAFIPPGEEPETPMVPSVGDRPNLRNVVTAEFTTLLSRESNRRNNEWRATLELVRGALVALDRSWGAAGGKFESPVSASAISDLVDVIVTAARRDTDAAVTQARFEAERETARVVDHVGRLKAELQAERDQSKATREAAQAELEAGRALVSQLRRQIETEKSERSKLFAVLQTVQRAVSSAETVDSAETNVSGSLASTVDDRGSIPQAERARVPTSADPPKIEAEPNAIAKEARPTAEANVPRAPEKLWNPTLVAVTERLFDEIERKYQRDVQENLSPTDVVDRLLANLQAGHADLRRSCSSDVEAGGLFERHMMMLLDSKAATSFGRHLSIAACHWAVPDDRKSV